MTSKGWEPKVFHNDIPVCFDVVFMFIITIQTKLAYWLLLCFFVITTIAMYDILYIYIFIIHTERLSAMFFPWVSPDLLSSCIHHGLLPTMCWLSLWRQSYQRQGNFLLWCRLMSGLPVFEGKCCVPEKAMSSNTLWQPCQYWWSMLPDMCL